MVCVCVVLDHRVGSSVCVWYWITVRETALPRTEFSYRLRRCRARMGFPGGASGKEPACQCKGWKRCGFDPWVGKIPWRRTWQPTSICLPGESYRQRSLAGYSPWGHRESDRTEATWHTSTHTEADLILGRKFIYHCRFLGREAAARQTQPSERRTGKTEY